MNHSSRPFTQEHDSDLAFTTAGSTNPFAQTTSNATPTTDPTKFLIALAGQSGKSKLERDTHQFVVVSCAHRRSRPIIRYTMGCCLRAPSPCAYFRLPFPLLMLQVFRNKVAAPLFPVLPLSSRYIACVHSVTTNRRVC